MLENKDLYEFYLALIKLYIFFYVYVKADFQFNLIIKYSIIKPFPPNSNQIKYFICFESIHVRYEFTTVKYM